MKQAITTLVLVGVIVGLLTVIVLGSKTEKSDTSIHTDSITENFAQQAEISSANIFYWGTTCPHCHDVIEWMEENKIEDQVSVVRKEVYQNKENSLELTQVAQSCGIPTNNIGVPFLHTIDKQCLLGFPEIVAYLSEQVAKQQGQQTQATESAERSQE